MSKRSGMHTYPMHNTHGRALILRQNAVASLQWCPSTSFQAQIQLTQLFDWAGWLSADDSAGGISGGPAPMRALPPHPDRVPCHSFAPGERITTCIINQDTIVKVKPGFQ